MNLAGGRLGRRTVAGPHGELLEETPGLGRAEPDLRAALNGTTSTRLDARRPVADRAPTPEASTKTFGRLHAGWQATHQLAGITGTTP